MVLLVLQVLRVLLVLKETLVVQLAHKELQDHRVLKEILAGQLVQKVTQDHRAVIQDHLVLLVLPALLVP